MAWDNVCLFCSGWILSDDLVWLADCSIPVPQVVPLHLVSASFAPVPVRRSRNTNVSITKCGSLPHTNLRAKLPGAYFSPILRFQPGFPSLGVCSALASPFLPTGAREDTPSLCPIFSCCCVLCQFSCLLCCARPYGQPRVVEINLTLAARFFLVLLLFFWQYTAILNGNCLQYNLGVAGLCVGAVELNANSLLESGVHCVGGKLTLQLDDSNARDACFKILVRQSGTESTQEQFIRKARMPVLNSSVGEHWFH